MHARASARAHTHTHTHTHVGFVQHLERLLELIVSQLHLDPLAPNIRKVFHRPELHLCRPLQDLPRRVAILCVCVCVCVCVCAFMRVWCLHACVWRVRERACARAQKHTHT